MSRVSSHPPRRTSSEEPATAGALLIPRLLDARTAAESGRWAEAFDGFTTVDTERQLSAEDLDRLAWAALFTGHAEVCAEARQRAFAGFVQQHDDRGAGFAALNLAMSHFGRGAPVVGAGWLEHAERYLGDDTDCEQHGWLLWARCILAAEGGADAQSALDAAEGLVSAGRRLASADVEALAQLLKAQLLIRTGQVAEGSRTLDQVMALAVGGCLGPFATSWVYCGTISTCSSAGDYERAWQWTEEVGRCSTRSGLSDFPGDCRLHRAELLRLHGDWSEAESEAARVCDELGSWHVGHVGTAYYELGELSLRKGDLDAADVAFKEAEQRGCAPEPGLTTLRLMRGETEAAAAAIREVLANAADDGCRRARLLPVAVEVALARNDVPWAEALLAELATLTETYPSPVQQARAAHAAGLVALAIGDAAGACDQLSSATQLWEAAKAPYDSAKTRVARAAAELERGHRDTHAVQLEAALATFERLGATLDVRRTAALLGRPARTARVSRALMFTDLERSTNLLASVGDDAWIELLRWHDAALRQLFERYHGAEIHQKGGGDGFFVAFTDAAAALDCAVAIQHRLRDRPDQRILVRVGVHWSEVLHADGDFSGRGVHEAARISSLADGGEILTSVATLEAASRHYPLKEVRRVELRGLPGDVEVASVDAAAIPTTERSERA